MSQKEESNPEPEVLHKKEKGEESEKEKTHTAMYSIFP